MAVNFAFRPGASLVAEAYDGLVGVLAGVGDEDSWRPTGCTGWAVRDLTHHCLADAQRALVALHSPTDAPADRDAVSYWSDWAPDAEGAARGRRFTRVGASMYLVWDQLRSLHADTSRAAVHAAAAADPSARVRTQGHVLGADDLLRTLVVEATLHHLDLVVHLPAAARPGPAGLAEVRRVLDGLLGAGPDAGPDEGPDEGLDRGPDLARDMDWYMDWDDERYALVATGRAAPTTEERRRLGTVADRFPLFS